MGLEVCINILVKYPPIPRSCMTGTTVPKLLTLPASSLLGDAGIAKIYRSLVLASKRENILSKISLSLQSIFLGVDSFHMGISLRIVNALKSDKLCLLEWSLEFISTAPSVPSKENISFNR